MSKLNISKTKDYLTKDGKPFFYLADTVWTAFSNIRTDEWEEYLEYRRMQCFNALQINILTQWDGGKPHLDIYPFRFDSEGRFDFYQINEEYFKRARIMLEMAVKKGFIPVLVILWDSYVKPGWPIKPPLALMPFDAVRPYVEYVVRMFSQYNPIFCISGDSELDSGHVNSYYTAAFEIVKTLCPDCVATLHTSGPVHDGGINCFENSEYLDFYMYQSSHNILTQNQAYTFAEGYYRKAVKRPIINSEPCYEGHSYIARYGRYNEFDVRRAIWQSLLSGAKAGVAYGALGLWNWFKDGKETPPDSSGGKSISWRQALSLKGAWDASFAKWLFEVYDLFDIEPCFDRIQNDTQEIRMSVSKDAEKIIIYVPYNIDVKVGMDLSGYRWTLVNLSDKLFAQPEIEVDNGMSIIKMHYFNSDVLLIGIRHTGCHLDK